MDQQLLILWRQCLAQSSDFEPFVVVLANKIRNHLNVVEMKNLARRILQIMRDRSDAVRLHDAITRNRQIRSIRADEGDVRAVQSRNYRQAPSRLERLARENRADRMRNRVMNVKQIEFLFLGDRRHLGRECEGVRLMLKQRVRHHLDFVETYTIVELSQPRSRDD